MGDGPTAAELVDRLLAAKKSLVGKATWQETGDPRELRATWPVMVGDEVPPGVTLVVNYYPNSNPPRFTISLNAPRSVARIDWGEDGGHTNSLLRPNELPAVVVGSHYHAWEDNRRFCTAHTLPSELPNARELPDNVRSFHNAFRWFLGEVGIDQPANDLIEPPRRSTLL